MINKAWIEREAFFCFILNSNPCPLNTTDDRLPLMWRERRHTAAAATAATWQQQRVISKERLIRYFCAQIYSDKTASHDPLPRRFTCADYAKFHNTCSFLQLKIMLCRTARVLTFAFCSVLINQNNLWPCQLSAFRLHVCNLYFVILTWPVTSPYS